MGSNIIELAKLGHERAAELKASCGAVDVRSMAQLISDLATQLEVQFVLSTNMAVQLANAESKCRELAAEVQAVRWACGQVYVKGYNQGHLNTVDRLPYADEKDLVMRGGEVLCEFTDPDHCGVAADAILAEVRAQGVEMFADSLKVVGGYEHPYSVVANEFAAQLRKGAAL